jgi:hypothetical protein
VLRIVDPIRGGAMPKAPRTDVEPRRDDDRRPAPHAAPPARVTGGGVGPGDPEFAAMPGAASSPENLLALQRSAGNRAVTDVLSRSAVVQREAADGANARPAAGTGVPLGPQDAGEVGTFLMAVTDAYAPCPVNRVPDLVGNGSPYLLSLEKLLVNTWILVRGENEAAERFAAHWDRLRPDLTAVGAWAAGQGFDAGAVARYRQSVTSIEHRFVRWYSRQVVDDGAAVADVGDPEAAYEEQLAKQFAATAAALSAALDTSAADRAKLLGQAKSGVKIAGEVAGGGSGKGAAAAKVTTELLALGLDAVAKGGTLKDQIDGLAKAGLLKQAATAIDVTAFVVDATHAVTTLLARTYVGIDEGQLLQTLSGKLDSAAVKQFKTASQVLGYATAILGIASGTLKLVAAIRADDERGIVEASGGLAAGLAGLAGTIAGVGATASAAIGGVISMWTWAFIAMGELGATLRALDLQAKANRVVRVVETAAGAAATGRRMAAAWDEAQLRKGAALERPDSVDAKAVEVLEATAQLEIRERLVPQMNAVLSGLNDFVDDPDVAPKVRAALSEHLGSIAVNFHQVEYLHPYAFTDLCRTVFADVDAVTREIAKQAGHLPDAASTSAR